MKKYWTCEVTYDGKEPFFYSSPDMFVEVESELEAEKLLESIVKDSWAKISPHPAPKLLSVLPLRVVYVKN